MSSVEELERLVTVERASTCPPSREDAKVTRPFRGGPLRRAAASSCS